MDENLAVSLQEVKDRSLRNEGRIKKLEENQHALNDLALSVRELATDQDNMKNDIIEIKTVSCLPPIKTPLKESAETVVHSGKWIKRYRAIARERNYP